MLEIDIATILFEVVNFLVLAILLYRFLFRPVMVRVNERGAEKERILSELAAEKKVLADQQTALDEALAQIDEQTAVILAQAHSEASTLKADKLKAAQTERNQILHHAQREMTQWQQQSVTTFHQTIVDTILDISGQLISRTVPQMAHDTLFDELNQEIWELGRHDIARVETIRYSLFERSPTAEVVTARPLTPQQQGKLIRTLTALADHQVSLEVTIDSSLAAGIRVRLGDLIVEHSIAGQLAEVWESVDDALRKQLRVGENGRV